MFKLDQESLISNNYYFHNIQKKTYPKVTGELSADVCIIGAGFSGLSTALELAKYGLTVIVLEAKTLGFGASGRNGGKAISGYSCSNSVFEKHCGVESAKIAWDISIAGINLIKQRCDEYKIDCNWQDGYMILATSASKAKKLHSSYIETRDNYNWPNTRWIDEKNIRSEIDSSAYFGGYFDGNGGHFHPVKYIFGIAKAAESHGAKIFEHSKVNEIIKGKVNILKTDDAIIKANYVVVAANVYLQDLIPELSKRIMPAGTWMVASEQLDSELVKRLIPSRAAIFDSNNVLDYFRFTGDNRLLFGGEVSYSSLFPKDLKKNLRKNISRVFPELSDINLEFAWGGHVDITLYRNPDFGRIGNNIYYMQGFSGQGVALTNIAGKLVADCIATGENRIDVFEKLPKVTFPGFGDYSRTLLLMIGMLYYRLLDIIG